MCSYCHFGPVVPCYLRRCEGNSRAAGNLSVNAVQLRLRGGVDDVIEGLLHGIFPADFDDDEPEEGDDLGHPWGNGDVEAPDVGGGGEGGAPAPGGPGGEGPQEPAAPGARPVLPKRPTARFYCSVANEPLHPGTTTTVNQAVYCALKIKVDYNVHDLAFDSMIKFASAILPPGHFLPG